MGNRKVHLNWLKSPIIFSRLSQLILSTIPTIINKVPGLKHFQIVPIPIFLFFFVEDSER